MKSKLSENMKELRKSQHLTQEQLADAMGVTVGAVYKWEQNLSLPDIRMIMELASFFGVSVDALIGYEVQSTTADAYAERIYTLQQKKAYEQAAMEAEKALARYPNQFQIVYRCGTLYEVKGIECSGPDSQRDIERAIELLQKAELLLSQNQDPNINAFTIRAAVANCFLVQGKKEQALKILKETNIGGVHDSQIGIIYAASSEYPPEKAAPYLTDAFQTAMSSLLRTMIGYLNYYERIGNPEAELEVSQWLIQYLESLRIRGRISVVDKYLAGIYSESARILNLLGRPEESVQALRCAYTLAKAYDANPSSSRQTIRFFLATEKDDTIYDDVGPTAMCAITQQIDRENWSNTMRSAWERIVKNDEEG